MNLNIEQVKTAAAGGDANAMSKLASMNLSGMFPGASPQEGIRLLEELVKMPERYAEMLELGLAYVKGEHVSGKKDEGLEWIEKGIGGLKDKVPFEHCFEVGMMLSNIKDENGERSEKVLKWQKLSAQLLEQAVADSEGMAMLETHMGQQVVMMVKGMLHSVKGWLSTVE